MSLAVLLFTTARLFKLCLPCVRHVLIAVWTWYNAYGLEAYLAGRIAGQAPHGAARAPGPTPGGTEEDREAAKLQRATASLTSVERQPNII